MDEPEDLTTEVKANPKPVFVGTYSHILKGSCRNRIVAVKVLHAISAQLTSMNRKIRRELEVWAHMNHPNIVPLLGYTTESDLFGDFGAFISPWYHNGNAAEFLQKHGESLDMEVRLKMIQGAVAGVEYLHAHDPVIIHGDLKPANILIDDDINAVICDFGLVSIYLEEGHSGHTTSSEHTGTDRYLAYELVTFQDASPSTFSDIWALGCVGLEFLYNIKPYQQHKSNRVGAIFQDIRSGIPPASRPSDIRMQDTYLWNILESCWNLDAKARATASLVSSQLSHTAFITVDPFTETTNYNGLKIDRSDTNGFYGSVGASQLLVPSQQVAPQQKQFNNTVASYNDRTYTGGSNQAVYDQMQLDAAASAAGSGYPLTKDLPDARFGDNSTSNLDMSERANSGIGNVDWGYSYGRNETQVQSANLNFIPETASKEIPHTAGIKQYQQSRQQQFQDPSTFQTQQPSQLFYPHYAQSQATSINQARPVHKRSHSASDEFPTHLQAPTLSSSYNPPSMLRHALLSALVDTSQFNPVGNQHVDLGGEGSSNLKGSMSSSVPTHRKASNNYDIPTTTLTRADPHRIQFPMDGSLDQYQRQAQFKSGGRPMWPQTPSNRPRAEVDEAMLRIAFTSQSQHPDPGLRALLDLVQNCQFYLDEELEPAQGTPLAEEIFARVRQFVPNDPRFAYRSTGYGQVPGQTDGAAGARDTQSIYMLFTESNVCLICGKKTDRSTRALGHVRSDIGHRPFHCDCEKCSSSDNPRSFFSETLLDDHLKGLVVKQKCPICGSMFRRGGIFRHMASKHADHPDNPDRGKIYQTQDA